MVSCGGAAFVLRRIRGTKGATRGNMVVLSNWSYVVPLVSMASFGLGGAARHGPVNALCQIDDEPLIDSS